MKPLPQKIVSGLTTKSAKITALAQHGYERTEIAEFLGIRYQHVRKVLIDKGFFGGLKGQGASVQKTEAVAAAKREINQSAQKLLSAGFIHLGEWQSIDERLRLSNQPPTCPGVYAFVIDYVVKYIGLTKSSLRSRLGLYVYGSAGQRTNARLKVLILGELQQGSRIDVLIATPADLEWNGLPIHSAAGLEAGLIRLMQPEWNAQGVG